MGGDDHGRVPDELLPLLEAAREGDQQALTRLVRRTQPAVWRLCTTLGSDGEVEDIVQEVYLRAVKAMPAYRGDAPVLPWLLSIARRTCADHVRRRQRHRRLIERLEHETTATDATARPVPTPIDDLLDSLDADRRDAFVLTQLVGLSYADAAHTLGCPIGTVRSRVSRARRGSRRRHRPRRTSTNRRQRALTRCSGFGNREPSTNDPAREGGAGRRSRLPASDLRFSKLRGWGSNPRPTD